MKCYSPDSSHVISDLVTKVLNHNEKNAFDLGTKKNVIVRLDAGGKSRRFPGEGKRGKRGETATKYNYFSIEWKLYEIER